MLDQQELKWIATTTTELSATLQQISRYCDLARRNKGNHSYLDLLSERVELAGRTAQMLFDRITTNILTKAARDARATKAPILPFTVLPPPPRLSGNGEKKPASPVATKTSSTSGTKSPAT